MAVASAFCGDCMSCDQLISSIHRLGAIRLAPCVIPNHLHLALTTTLTNKSEVPRMNRKSQTEIQIWCKFFHTRCIHALSETRSTLLPTQTGEGCRKYYLISPPPGHRAERHRYRVPLSKNLCSTLPDGPALAVASGAIRIFRSYSFDCDRREHD